MDCLYRDTSSGLTKEELLQSIDKIVESPIREIEFGNFRMPDVVPHLPENLIARGRLLLEIFRDERDAALRVMNEFKLGYPFDRESAKELGGALKTIVDRLIPGE